MSSLTRVAPPDQRQREQALDARRSILVQAPAGSGKTDLLTRRFLRLLGEVDDPRQIVAITFTKAAAAEMRNRILAELEKAARAPGPEFGTWEVDMQALAHRALHRSLALGWDLLQMPTQLRISTIDSFCRELALQQPLVSDLGAGLDITENPTELYRRAARRTLEQIDQADPPSNGTSSNTGTVAGAIETLLLWRDNAWQEMETLLVTMLAQRDRWMHDFVLQREPDWDRLREKLERPFTRAVADALAELDQLLDQEMRDEAMELARFACGQRNNWLQCKLFQLSGFPCEPFHGTQAVEGARQGYVCLAEMLLTKDGDLRRSITVRDGFPRDRPQEKARVLGLLDHLESIPGFESKLDSIRNLPPARYPEEDWQIIRACFTLLRHAAGELRVEFAQAGVVDFAEIAQVAQRVLMGEDGLPSDAAIKIADDIRHLLVDEFQDTSRRQHKLIGSLVKAWPDFEGRSVFLVGDPMQSIYFFRDADAELFPRVRSLGLEIPDAEPLKLHYVPLASNFRTAPQLVDQLNQTFAQIFAVNDGSGVSFSPAEAARTAEPRPEPSLHLHLDFIPQTVRGYSSSPDLLQRKEEATRVRQATHEAQTAEIVALIRAHIEHIVPARARGEKYRIAVLGRTHKALEPVARALRDTAIPFRAVDLEHLADRPEVVDVLALARALLNPEDRVAWLGVLRAPWCGLSLADLHKLAGADDAALLRRPIPELLAERLSLLSSDGRKVAGRVLEAFSDAQAMRVAAATRSLGTLLERIWLRLGGDACVDAAGRANLDLLWKSLDQLENGEPDLLGSGLNAALEKLFAQPDPAASSDHGVQLMTIHKAKGLEFEVVIVPDLHAGCGRPTFKLLSWLERGLPSADDSGDITEFLVAPLPSKGAESGKAKQWVERMVRERGSQEIRRILYVAATRAREELHLFARPEYKAANGGITLCDPSGSLLATAWPALEGEIRAQFDEWQHHPRPADIDLAAGATILEMPQPAKPALLRRLPPDFQPSRTPSPNRAPSDIVEAGLELYQRHEGGILSRELGSAVHALLEELARLRIDNDWPAARKTLELSPPRIAAQLRSAGVEPNQAVKIAAQAVDIAVHASHDPNAQWILSPHPGAASEARWAGLIAGVVREVRVDRLFQAGTAPGSEGGECWWIIDYKTTDGKAADTSALLELRKSFAPQLEIYAQVLRNLQGKDISIRAGLYYPRMTAFDWWEL